MRYTIKDWFRQKTSRQKRPNAPPSQPSSDVKVPVPQLPSPRPRPLTPTPSNPTPDGTTATLKSRFFQDLPAEIRRQILVEAFGDRILHMHLEYSHKLARPPRDAKRAYHRGVTFESEKYSPSSVKYDTRGEKRWWWGMSSVCHRNSPLDIQAGYQGAPDDDTCISGRARCQDWPGETPQNCLIGAIGWLLSCRQAYSEGIEVLYSTNTMHISSITTLTHLPQLLLPQRLAAITAAEIVWSSKPRSTGVEAVRESIETMIQAIEAALPNVQKLHVDLVNCYAPSNPDYNARSLTAETEILEPIDALVKRLRPTLKDLVLGVPESVFEPRDVAAQIQALPEKYKKAGRDQRSSMVWRVVSGEAEGYRLRQTDWDISRVVVCTMGEGGWGGFPRTYIMGGQSEVALLGTDLGWITSSD